MLYDPLIVVARSRLEDRFADAARRALLAEAAGVASARSTIAVRIGRLCVWIGERIEGVRYVPDTTLSPRHLSR